MVNLKDTRSFSDHSDQYMKWYLGNIRKYPELDKKEEYELARLSRKGCKEAEERLICSNLRFVVKTAKLYRKQGLIIGDLINEGNLGLIKSIGKFDENLGYKIISYAKWDIEQTIEQAIAEKGKSLKISIGTWNQHKTIMRAYNVLEQKLERTPEISEIADFTGLEIEDIKIVFKHIPDITPQIELDAYVNPNNKDKGKYVDRFEQTIEPSPDENLNKESVTYDVLKFVDSLKIKKYRDIIKFTFGLDYYPLLNKQNIAELYEISEENVRIITAKAIEILKQKSNCHKLKEYWN